MAVIIEATYSKKLGLPQYSSHQYALTVRTEVTDLSALAQTSEDLYARLQHAVDSQILQTGFVPGNGSGNTATGTTPPRSQPADRPAGSNSPNRPGDDEAWNCSDKQRDLILKLVDEHHLDKTQVESLAQQRFGAGVRQLDKLQASALIDELIETHGGTGSGRGRGQGNRRGYSRNAYAGRGRQ